MGRSWWLRRQAGATNPPSAVGTRLLRVGPPARIAPLGARVSFSPRSGFHRLAGQGGAPLRASPSRASRRDLSRLRSAASSAVRASRTSPAGNSNRAARRRATAPHRGALPLRWPGRGGRPRSPGRDGQQRSAERRRATDVAVWRDSWSRGRMWKTRPLRTQTWKCFTPFDIGRITQLRDSVPQAGRTRTAAGLSTPERRKPVQGL